MAGIKRGVDMKNYNPASTRSWMLSTGKSERGKTKHAEFIAEFINGLEVGAFINRTEISKVIKNNNIVFQIFKILSTQQAVEMRYNGSGFRKTAYKKRDVTVEEIEEASTYKL
jgi:hypothetical protein